MPLSDLTRDAVLAAIELSNSLGRDAFLKLGNFKRARGYFLVYGGRTYDSKAVAGAAHGYLPGKKALTSGDFFGGYATVKKKWEELGFEVHSPNETPGAGTNPGDILTNDDIVVRFGVGNMGGMRRNRQRKHLVLAPIRPRACTTIAGKVTCSTTPGWESSGTRSSIHRIGR